MQKIVISCIQRCPIGQPKTTAPYGQRRYLADFNRARLPIEPHRQVLHRMRRPVDASLT